jgi:dTDP-4-dehydro-6-deoxy-alpha-D-glucopyranose 2,3-dehydratase
MILWNEKLTDLYRNNLNKYLGFTQELGVDKTFATFRLEAQFESLKDWCQTGNIESKKAWFQEQKARCTMKVESIPLTQCRGWTVDEEVTHESGEFFKIEGLRVTLSSSREVKSGWDQPILTQIGYDGGLLGIIRKSINGIPHYLLEAKAEPGNYGLTLLSPTLQATFSNLKKAHGGSKPKFSEYFETPEQNNGEILFSQWMSEDGGRLHNKRNKGMIVQVPEDKDLEYPDSFQWFSLWQIKELISEDAWVNPHIRSIISHL